MQKITVTDLGHYPGLWVERAHKGEEPIVVTHHGDEIVVMIPIELRRRLTGEEEPTQLPMALPEQKALGAA